MPRGQLPRYRHGHGEDAKAFLRRLNEHAGTERYRLPSEAEWEKTCRATPACSVQITNGWFKGHSGNTTHPADQTMPNAWGLFDMTGNVLEWRKDVHHADDA